MIAALGDTWEMDFSVQLNHWPQDCEPFFHSPYLCLVLSWPFICESGSETGHDKDGNGVYLVIVVWLLLPL